MTLAEILVPLSGAATDTAALDTAFAIAAPFGAHVTALFSAKDARDAVLAEDLHETVPVRGARIAGAREQARLALTSAARKADAVLRTTAEKCGTLSACYRETPGQPADVLAEAAMFADLVVFASDAAEGALRQAFIRLLTESEKPVLLAGRAAPAPARIAIAWDGSLPAARALTASLALLEKTKDVDLLCVGEPTGIAAADAIGYLALHGVTARLRPLEQASVPIGVTLLAAAKDADLLVLGAYGHNRLVERIFGGTTAHILAHAGMPLLLAH